ISGSFIEHAGPGPVVRAPVMRVVATCITSLLALSACAGGGASKGGNPAASRSSISLDLPRISAPEVFETVEYRRSGGLEPVNASALYAAGGSGAGVTVALIDTGVDTGHSEFAGALHPASRDLLRSTPLADGSGHGTAVAGLLAGRRDG